MSRSSPMTTVVVPVPPTRVVVVWFMVMPFTCGPPESSDTNRLAEVAVMLSSVKSEDPPSVTLVLALISVMVVIAESEPSSEPNWMLAGLTDRKGSPASTSRASRTPRSSPVMEPSMISSVPMESFCISSLPIASVATSELPTAPVCISALPMALSRISAFPMALSCISLLPTESAAMLAEVIVLFAISVPSIVPAPVTMLAVVTVPVPVSIPWSLVVNVAAGSLQTSDAPSAAQISPAVVD